jgi:hypothetical protein
MEGDSKNTHNNGKVKTCGYFYCTRKQRYVLCGLLILPVVFLVCLIIGILIKAAVEKERFQRLTLDPVEELLMTNILCLVS